MIPATFDYAVPDSLEEAVRLLQQHGEDAKVLTGGHSLIPLLRMRLSRPSLVVDLRRIPALREIAVTDDGLEIGAAATHADVQRSPDVRRVCALLCQTAARIGDLQVRNAGTIGGSVVHADPAADWPAAMLATSAAMVLLGPSGERTVPAEDFFVGALQSAIRPGEILTSIRVPAAPEGAGSSYQKAAQSASGFALAGVAAQLTVAGGAIREARIGVTGVAERPYRPRAVEEELSGTDEAAVAAVCDRAALDVRPLEDIHASAAYRAQLARVLCRRAVLAAIAAGSRR